MKELLRRLIIRPGLTSELVLASLFANVLALAPSLFVIQVLNRYVANGINSTLMTLTIGVAIAIVLEFAFRQVRNRLAKGISSKQDEEISRASFNVLATAKAGAIERLPPGQQREIIAGIDNIRNAYGAANISSILDLPFALLFLGVLYLLTPELGIIATLFALIAFLIGLLMTAVIRVPTHKLTDTTRRTNIVTFTAIQESDTLRVFNAANFLAKAWQAQINFSQNLYRSIISRQGLLASISQSIVGLMAATLMAVGAVLVVDGKLDIGALIGANILAARALQPISKFSQMGEIFLKAKQAGVLLNEFLKLPREAETGSAKQHYTGSLELRDLGFSYQGATGPLFESLSVKIPAGTICVINGSNGAGKTTLSRLIVGLIEPGRGQILADGLDLRQVHPQWWRKQVMYMPQEPGFFNATLMENLTINAPDPENNQLNQIIDASDLRQFLDEAPNGFDTPITDNGRKLAVGIRRRLALARALTTNGKLLVFDEPTEGMDKKGSAAVSSILSSLHSQGYTIIITSHDTEVIKQANIFIDLTSKPIPKIRIKKNNAPEVAQ
jgi:ATP-binding cassette, subfamily C, bacterial LapB